MAEVIKHQKSLASLKMLEDEAIIVYTFLVVVPSLFGGKITTKSDITYLPTYVKCQFNHRRTISMSPVPQGTGY